MKIILKYFKKSVLLQQIIFQLMSSFLRLLIPILLCLATFCVNATPPKDPLPCLDKKFTISYIGLLPKQSNPKLLFKVLSILSLENSDFKKDLEIKFIGDISEDVNIEINSYDLSANTSFIGYVSHEKAIDYQKKSQVLLLLIPNIEKSEGILTGKLFEYLTAKRPILAIGPETGDLSDILKNTNAGVVLNFDNEERLTSEIRKLYSQYKTGNLKVDSKNIEQYHRKELTNSLSEIIKSL